mgnify:CR=1 FL=1
MNDPLVALGLYLVFLVSVTLHEAAHAWAAMRGGDLTAYQGGQVSLDPRPHIRREPVGMVLLPLVSVSISGFPFGFASTPFDPAWAALHPRRAAWMALAGPGANLAMMLVAVALIRLGVGLGQLEAPDQILFSQIAVATAAGNGADAFWAQGLSAVLSLNLILFLLNMLPLPPFDGASALPLLLPARWNDAYQGFLRRPMFGWVGILLAWHFFGEIYGPCLLFVVSLLYPDVGYG